MPQFYVKNSHPPIIQAEVFDLVQQELAKRKRGNGYTTGSSCFSGKIICGECGSSYGRKVWHSNDKYRRVIWQRNNKFTNDKKCQTPHLYEDNLKKAFVEVINCMLDNKEEILAGLEDVICTLTDTTEQAEEEMKFQNESETVAELLKQSVGKNAHLALDQAEYQDGYAILIERYEAAKGEIKGISEKERSTA